MILKQAKEMHNAISIEELYYKKNYIIKRIYATSLIIVKGHIKPPNQAF